MVAKVVDEFYRRVEADAPLRAVYPADLEPGKEKLKLFIVQWLGGPAGYSERYGHPRLRRRHFPFVIDDRAAGRWLKHMREAMQHEGVDAELVDFIFERFGPLARHMVNVGQDVPRDPIDGQYMQ